MSSNRTARQELERIFGKKCFFKRAKCAKRIEVLGGIKTYKTFLEQRKYTGKKISHQLTYHHLRHKSEGGTASVENGAILEEIAHQYIHSLPRDQEEVVNEMFREFKLGFGVISTEGVCETGFKQLDFDIEEDALIIQAYSNTKEEYLQAMEEELTKKANEEYKKKEKYKRLKNPTRAMQKRELQKLIDEEERDL